MKAIYVVMMELIFWLAKRDQLIDEDEHSYILNEMHKELKKNDPEAKKLIKIYKDLSDKSQPMIPYDMSKKCFKN